MNNPTMGWGKAVLFAILWFAVGVVILVPLLFTQAKIFLRNNWFVPGFSTAELVQAEFLAVMAILALIIGWLHRSWKIVILLSACAIAGALLLGSLMFALDPPFVGM